MVILPIGVHGQAAVGHVEMVAERELELVQILHLIWGKTARELMMKLKYAIVEHVQVLP